MNHLTTEPIESKSGDEPSTSGATATSEKEPTSSANGEIGVNKRANRTRATFVPPLDPAIGIELRVTRAGMPARRLRINSARCTFGSGEGCTVRLSDTSLRPLHAVILRDNGRILVRGYSVPLEINGEFVPESLLTLGDVIRIGQYCFEMIDLPSSDSENYEEESIVTSQPLLHPSEMANAKSSERSPNERRVEAEATSHSSSDDSTSKPKRLKFSQPTASGRSKALRASAEQSVLDGLQVSQRDVHFCGQGDELVVDEIAVREPVTSLAQIHVQAKRNSELMAEVAATRKREQDTSEKLAQSLQKWEATEAELVKANEAIVALTAQVALLNDQAQKLTNDALEQQAIASAEHAKLNRAIAAHREAGAASQKAEAATRQSLQESIRQRDDALSQRASAIDAQQLTRTKLEEAEAHIRRLNHDAEEASAELTRFKSEAEKSRARIDELKDVCCGQADQITKLSMALEASQSSELSSVTRLKDTINQLQNELDASRQRIVVADLERVQLNTLQSTLENTLQEHLSEKLSWGEQSDTLTHEVETLTDELRSTTTELNRSRNETAKLLAQVNDIQLQVSDLKSELSSRPTIEQLHETRSQLAQSEIDLENSVRQLEQLREDYDQLASQRVSQESNQRMSLQPPTGNESLPHSLFPVPAFAGSAIENELPVEATHPTNIQEIVASAAAEFASIHADSHLHRPQQAHSEKQPVGSTAVDDIPLGDEADAESHWHQALPQSQSTRPQEESTTSESSWNTPASASTRTPSKSWNVDGSGNTAAEPLQPVGPVRSPVADLTPDPSTQSQWLKASHSRDEVMRAVKEEESFHTEPMNRAPGGMFSKGNDDGYENDFSPTSRFEDVAIEPSEFLSARPASEIADREYYKKNADGQPSADDESEADEQSLLAALIERSEGSKSNWFADYTSSHQVNPNADTPEEPKENQAVLDRLNQYVRSNHSDEDEISDAIAESEHNGLDPESSALSLARMLINELDCATQDSKLRSSEPDPLVKSKRLVGASVFEQDGSDHGSDSNDDEHSSHVEMRRKDFDERAFRDSFAGVSNEDVTDPNADEATYSVQGESNQASSYGIVTPTKAVEAEEEDSVEAYMNQLLRRMGQEPATHTKVVEEPATPVATPFTASKPQEAVRTRPEITRPKRPVPELEVPLDQMRELANQSAASAISTSNRKGLQEMRSKAIIDGIQASVVGICAAIFFYCGMTSSNLSLVWNTAGALAIALSGFFSYEMYRKLKLAAKGA
jgi:hypothetical protein